MQRIRHATAGATALIISLWVVAVIAIGGSLYGVYRWQHHQVETAQQQTAALQRQLKNADDDTGSPSMMMGANANSATPANPYQYNSTRGVKLLVYTPARDSQLASPLVVMGQVPGNWSFEASFPVKLLDASGKTLASAPAHLLGEWTTTKFVPFTANLTYTAPAGNSGKLVLQKDNPSGEAANDDSVTIPVKL